MNKADKTRLAIVKILIVAIIIVAFGGCRVTATQTEDKFFIVLEDCVYYKIVYCTSTGVMYVESWGADNHGTFSPLYNADGTLMIYQGGD